MQKEARARILINGLLTKSGWRFFDDENGPANISLETHVKLKKKILDDLGEDFEKTVSGFVDYRLLDDRGFPVAVLEAKSEKYDPLIGKEKARRYAQSQNARFIILSNGNLHYFWDLEQGNPTLITEFPTPESLSHFQTFNPNPEALINEKVEKDYIALTQNPNYSSDPRWHNLSERDAYIKDSGLHILRPYQLRAIEALQKAIKKNHLRYSQMLCTGVKSVSSDGFHQAACSSTPSTNVTPSITFDSRTQPLSLCQCFSASRPSLNTIASVARREPHPFVWR